MEAPKSQIRANSQMPRFVRPKPETECKKRGESPGNAVSCLNPRIVNRDLPVFHLQPRVKLSWNTRFLYGKCEAICLLRKRGENEPEDREPRRNRSGEGSIPH